MACIEGCEKVKAEVSSRAEKLKRMSTHVGRVVTVVALGHVVALHGHMEVVAVGDGPSGLGNSVDGSDALQEGRLARPFFERDVRVHLVSSKVPPLGHGIMREDLEATLAVGGGVLQLGEHEVGVDVRGKAKTGGRPSCCE